MNRVIPRADIERFTVAGMNERKQMAVNYMKLKSSVTELLVQPYTRESAFAEKLRLKHGLILGVVPTLAALAPHGEPYVVISGVGGEEEAEIAFDAYANGKSGTIYWRVQPELSFFQKSKRSPSIERFYMRLVIGGST